MNSVNDYRIEGQKTGAFEVCDEFGEPPDVLAIPVGNAGNITSWWRGFTEWGHGHHSMPRLHGYQAAGAAPLVHGKVVEQPETIASAIRIGNPARWEEAMNAVTASRGEIRAVTDDEIIDAYEFLGAREGVFCEPASAASVAGVIKYPPTGERVVCVLTGHGLKDPQTALSRANAVVPCEPDLRALEKAVLELVQRRRLVRVPASTANLGPGYDAFGAAISLYLELEVEETGELVVETEIDSLPADRSNLCVRAFEALHPADGVTFRIKSEIPLSSGLGSSAAAIVAGLVAADHMYELDAPLFELAAELEGHPDNVAAALMGGFVICTRGDAPYRFDLGVGLEGVMVTPPDPVRTDGCARRAAGHGPDGGRRPQPRARFPVDPGPGDRRSVARRARAVRPPAPESPRASVSALDGAAAAGDGVRGGGGDDLGGGADRAVLDAVGADGECARGAEARGAGLRCAAGAVLAGWGGCDGSVARSPQSAVRSPQGSADLQIFRTAVRSR